MNGHPLRTALGIAAVFGFVRFVLDALASPWKERAEALLLVLLLALA